MRGHIDVTLEPDEALAIVEASFAADGGWIVKRRTNGLLVEVGPKPDAGLPETLALRVDVEALASGGARLVVRVVRTHVLETIGLIGLDLLCFYGLGTVLHLGQMIAQRRERRGAKRRLLRLAIEPLMPHQCEGDLGPFRRGRGE